MDSWMVGTLINQGLGYTVSEDQGVVVPQRMLHLVGGVHSLFIFAQILTINETL